MYIHLGGGVVISSKQIIGIFDIDYCSVDKRTREFLAKAQETGRVINITEDLPKSFVVCHGDDGETIYICGVSPLTLKRRAGKNN